MATTKKSKKTKKDATPVSRASITKNLLKTRVSKPTFGKWSSGFSAVKKYSEDNKIPLIAVWSNGDACGHCTMFETAVMNSKFTKWMSTSKCVFWFGCSSDTSKDDKFEGTGFTWTRNGKLTTYPFVRVYWKAGKVDKYDSGDYWIDKKSTGYTAFINKLNSLLKKYLTSTTTTTTTTTPTEPTTEPETPVKPETPVDNPTDPDNGECGNCTVGGCSKEECDKLKEQVKELTDQNEKLESLANSYLSQIQEKDTVIAETKEAVNTFIYKIQDAIEKVKLDLGI